MHTKFRLLGTVGVCALLVPPLAGCGSPTQGESSGQGADVVKIGSVTGLVLASGGPLAVNPDGSMGSVYQQTPMYNSEVVLKSGEDIIATTKADDHGAFTFEATPGTYTVEATACPGNATVTLKAGDAFTADVNCAIR